MKVGTGRFRVAPAPALDQDDNNEHAVLHLAILSAEPALPILTAQSVAVVMSHGPAAPEAITAYHVQVAAESQVPSTEIALHVASSGSKSDVLTHLAAPDAVAVTTAVYVSLARVAQ